MKERFLKPATLSLDACIQRAPVIGICRCRVVETRGGVRIARVVVETPLKGCGKGQEFSYVAERTWTCDTTKAESGERTLMFLHPLERNPFMQGGIFKERGRRFDAARKKELRGVALYQVFHSGNGRMLIQPWRGADHVRPGYYIRMPSVLPSVKDTGESWKPDLYPLDSVTSYVAQCLNPRCPGPANVLS